MTKWDIWQVIFSLCITLISLVVLLANALSVKNILISSAMSLIIGGIALYAKRKEIALGIAIGSVLFVALGLWVDANGWFAR